MDDGAREERLVLRTPAAGGFERRAVVLEPGETRPFIEAEWRDALVVVVAGSIEIETRRGVRSTFIPGDVVFLTGLSVRVLRNRGRMSAVLDTVRRRSAAANDDSRPMTRGPAGGRTS
jgi:hypothetical protein